MEQIDKITMFLCGVETRDNVVQIMNKFIACKQKIDFVYFLPQDYPDLDKRIVYGNLLMCDAIYYTKNASFCRPDMVTHIAMDISLPKFEGEYIDHQIAKNIDKTGRIYPMMLDLKTEEYRRADDV